METLNSTDNQTAQNNQSKTEETTEVSKQGNGTNKSGSIDNEIEQGPVEELTVIKQQLNEKEDKIKELETKVATYEDLVRRKQAEFENFRKRTTREREEFKITANQKIIEALLPIVDNFEKAIQSTQDDQGDINTIKEGILLIEKQLKKLLESYNVIEIESVGKEFDPNLHEALQIDHSITDYETDTVIIEWQKGYLLGEKVIRHAKVVVAKGQGKEVKQEEKNDTAIPNSFAMNRFENEILAKIDKDEQKKVLQEAYFQDAGEYFLKNDLSEEQLKQLQMILDSIGVINQ